MKMLVFVTIFAVLLADAFGQERIVLPPLKGFWTYPPLAQITQNGLPAPMESARAASYICVAPGTCSCNGCTIPGNGDIDIRIVTPNDLCPPGLVPCYGFQCGSRVPPTNSADGFSENGTFPWQAYLEFNGQFAGSGVLLDSYHVLTAAHKVEQYSGCCQSNLVVYMGVWDPQNKIFTQSSQVAEIVIHEDYSKQWLTNDIAILRLANPIVFGAPHIGTICMPSQGQAVAEGTMCMVSGWGQTEFNKNDAPTNPQKQVTVPIVSLANCKASMGKVISNVDQYLPNDGTNVCAGSKPMKDACLQDGGSPLVCLNPATNTYFVYGLVIWGKGCGTEGIPGVYVGVPSYTQWIQNKIGAFNG